MVTVRRVLPPWRTYGGRLISTLQRDRGQLRSAAIPPFVRANPTSVECFVAYFDCPHGPFVRLISSSGLGGDRVWCAVASSRGRHSVGRRRLRSTPLQSQSAYPFAPRPPPIFSNGRSLRKRPIRCFLEFKKSTANSLDVSRNFVLTVYDRLERLARELTLILVCVSLQIAAMQVCMNVVEVTLPPADVAHEFYRTWQIRTRRKGRQMGCWLVGCPSTYGHRLSLVSWYHGGTPLPAASREISELWLGPWRTASHWLVSSPLHCACRFFFVNGAKSWKAATI